MYYRKYSIKIKYRNDVLVTKFSKKRLTTLLIISVVHLYFPVKSQENITISKEQCRVICSTILKLIQHLKKFQKLSFHSNLDSLFV